MAVKIRLSRRGRKKLAMYDVVVTQSRAPRDGVFIEKIGTYNPLTNPATINLNEDKALEWIMKGAQPSDTVRAMLSYKGVMIRKHLQVGVIKGALSQEEADKRFAEWKTKKDAQINARIEKLASDKEALLKDRHEKETKINESRAAALRKKQADRAKEEAAQAAASQPKEEVAEAAPETQAESPAPATEEAPAQEPVAEVKEEPKAEEPQKEEPKAVESQKEEPKAVESQKEEPKAEESQKEEPKAEESQKEEPKAEESKKEDPKAEAPKEAAPEKPAEPEAKAEGDDASKTSE